MKILVKNAQIVTMDEHNSIIKNGYLLTSDEDILYVGDIEPKEYDYVIDGKNKVVLPGLINAHSHVAMTVLRGYAEGVNLQDWLFEKIFPIEEKLTKEDIRAGVDIGICEMIKSGTTLVNDCYYFMDTACDAYLEANFKVNASRGLLNTSEGEITDDFRLNEALELFKNYNNKNNLIKVELFPHAVYTCSPSYLKLISEVSEKYQIPIATHLGETLKENEDCILKYGKTATAIYHGAGLFKNVINCAHGVYLNDDDLEIIRKSNSSITHNPTSNLKLISGVCDVKKYQSLGINIALGTDGAASNNNLDLFFEMKLCALLMAGVNNPNFLPIDPYNVLKMATVNGAKALSRAGETGVLKKGLKADFILLNLDEPHHYPMHNVVNNLIYSAKSSDVTTSVINGKIVYHQNEFKTIDIEKAKYRMNKTKKRLF